MKDYESHIRETWFSDHKADLQEHGDLKVLVWKKPGTSMYYCRYVFDGSRMYISGDIGEAVFWFTEKADVFNQCTYGLGYFEGKLVAYGENRRDFDDKKAEKALREWAKELKENDVKYDHDQMRELFSDARDNCSTIKDWHYALNNHSDWIGEIDCDYWEWMYNIGDEIPMRIKGYLVGLKMAAEQLKSKSVSA